MALDDAARPAWQFDPSAVRTAYRRAAEAWADAVGGVGDAGSGRWEQPGLGEWTVRDLVGHGSRSLILVPEYLDAAAGRPVEVDHPLGYYRSAATDARANPAAITERGRQAGRALGDDPAAAVVALAQRAVTRMDAEPDDAPLVSPAGVMRLVDYLPSRVLELVVHRLDLARATGVADPAQGPDVALAAALAGGVLAQSRRAGAVLLTLTGRAPWPEGTSVV